MRALACAIVVLGCSKHHREEPKLVAPPPKPVAIDALTDFDEPDVPPPKFDFAKLTPLELADLAHKKIHLGDQLRDVNVLAFWASWCHPCLDELPKLDVLYRKMRGNKRVAIIAINVADEPDAAHKELDRLKLTLPVLFDSDEQTYHLLFGGGSSVSIPAVAVFNHERPIAGDTGNDDAPTEELVAKLQKQIAEGLAPTKAR